MALFNNVNYAECLIAEYGIMLYYTELAKNVLFHWSNSILKKRILQKKIQFVQITVMMKCYFTKKTWQDIPLTRVSVILDEKGR